MNLALVHDDLIQHGGAERLFVVMAEIWPEASVFTSMVAGKWKMLNDKWKISTSFMQHLPFKKKLYRAYFPLYPLAFESFDFSGFDVVLSSSTRFAHGIITKPETKHICYMNTPGRMFWEPREYFSSFRTGQFSSPPEEKPPRFSRRLGNRAGVGLLGVALSPLLSWFRQWDYSAAQRVDYFIANSRSVKKKIKKYYGRDSEVIYPFVELERFNKDVTRYPLRGNTESSSTHTASPTPHNDYFLIVSRLASWKRIDIAIEACNQLKLPLVIVGAGPDRRRLQKLAGPQVIFLGRLLDEDVIQCYQSCRALIFPQREDFGITPLEAMASGKPVLAYKAGGALETVLPGETGEFFYPQMAEALVRALSNFRPEKYNPAMCRNQAARFSKQQFIESMKHFVAKVSR